MTTGGEPKHAERLEAGMNGDVGALLDDARSVPDLGVDKRRPDEAHGAFGSDFFSSRSTISLM